MFMYIHIHEYASICTTIDKHLTAQQQVLLYQYLNKFIADTIYIAGNYVPFHYLGDIQSNGSFLSCSHLPGGCIVLFRLFAKNGVEHCCWLQIYSL